MARVVVLDNGAGCIKAGWAGQANPAVVAPNVAARIKRQQRLLLADETESNIKDMSQLQFMRPQERGYVTDTFTQGAIWERILGPKMLGLDFKAQGLSAASSSSAIAPKDCALLLTSQPFAPASIERDVNELVFESMGFSACHRTVAPSLSLAQVWRSDRSTTASASSPSPSPGVLPMSKTGTGIIVDSGFSCTHVVPFQHGRVVYDAVKRVDVGGKFITNYLKELISYRQWNMMNDTIVVNQIKEKLAFVSLAYDFDLEIAKRFSAPAVLKAATSFPTPEHAAWPAFTVRGAKFGTDMLSSAVPYPVNDGVGVAFRREYVLPDYLHIDHGFVKGTEEDPNVKLARELALSAADARAPKPTPQGPPSHHSEPPPTKGHASGAQAVTSKGKPSADVAGEKRKRRAEEASEPSKSTTSKQKGKGSSRSKRSAPKAKRGRRGRGDDDEEEEEESGDDDDTDTDTLTESSDSDASSENGSEDGDYEREAGALPTREHAGSRAASVGVGALIAEAEPGSAYNEADLQVLVMNSERFAAPELLFRPAIAGLDEGGVHEAVAQAIAACSPDIRDALWSSIVLTGGNARMPGFEARLAKELRPLAPPYATVQLHTPADPHVAAWRGGSYFGAQPVFAKAAVTKAMYMEFGADAVHRFFTTGATAWEACR